MRAPSRRHILRGAGLALALPWLESLAPRRARGQAAPARVRFVPIYFPLGTASFWKPAGTGAGAAWKLSPILEPLTALKDRVTVLGHVDQTAYGMAQVIPGNGLLTGSYLTGVRLNYNPTIPVKNGISIDQRVAQTLVSPPAIPSLQLGLATVNSYCDGAPCAYSRSISWKDATTPLFKTVNPQAAFDAIVTGGKLDVNAAARRDARRSVLDYVAANATSVKGSLGHSDRQRMDQFLTAVRNLEQRIQATQVSACVPVPRPTLAVDVGNVPLGYDRNAHADLMIDLIVMALSCDATRVVSFMLDDARSDFVYTLDGRHFTATESTPTGMTVMASPLGLANTSPINDMWATLGRWYVSKLASLCGKMAAIPDGGGATLLDNSVVWFGSGMQGETSAADLPVLYVGGGGGRLKTGLSLDFAPRQSLSNVYLTFLRHVFGVQDAAFGDSTGVVSELVV